LGYAHPFGEGLVYGAERMIYYLIRELRDRGHECVVFSIKGCNLPGFEVITLPLPWQDDVDVYYEAVKGYEASRGVKFDYIHSYMASGYIKRELRSEWPYSLEPFFHFGRFKDNIIWYSKKLQSLAGGPGNGTVIYFGLPEEDYSTWSEDHKGYLAWLGRMDMGKAPDIAIEIAKRSGHRLVLMGPSYHYPYCQEHIFQHIDNENIIWLRGCTDEIKRRVLLGAKALIAPLWAEYHEMFGIVNVEALACGTPIIGIANTAQPSAINFDGGEIIEDSKHGFVICHYGYDNEQRDWAINCGVSAVGDIENISRRECRELYLSRFTSKIMTDKHLKYFDVVKEKGVVGDVMGEL
jgi:glycosyltransferase involved in cell wall biosynthesis